MSHLLPPVLLGVLTAVLQPPAVPTPQAIRTATVPLAQLPAALVRVCDEEKTSYHRLLWRTPTWPATPPPRRLPGRTSAQSLAKSGATLLHEGKAYRNEGPWRHTS